MITLSPRLTDFHPGKMDAQAVREMQRLLTATPDIFRSEQGT